MISLMLQHHQQHQQHQQQHQQQHHQQQHQQHQRHQQPVADLDDLANVAKEDSRLDSLLLQLLWRVQVERLCQVNMKNINVIHMLWP